MKIMTQFRRAVLALGAAVVAAIPACRRDSTGPGGGGGGGGGGGFTDSIGPSIQSPVVVDGKHGFRLSNGNLVFLDPIAEREQWNQGLAAPRGSASGVLGGGNFSGPSSVDLRPFQTPVRDQAARRTCSIFAAVAAIEAAYRHAYGLTLDLSEEYAWRIIRTTRLDENTLQPAVKAENHVATWGAGSVAYNLALLAKGIVGLPEEADLPYVRYSEWEATNQNGDMPFLDGSSPQRAVNDFNLSDTAATYYIPFKYAPVTMLPLGAQARARYRPTQLMVASPSDLVSVDWFKAQLAAGHEVAFEADLTNDKKATQNTIWVPGDTTWDAHAMLMVGYSDSLQAFLVKNSWGTGFADSGYVWFSYDWVTDYDDATNTQGRIVSAVVVLAVAPPNTPAPQAQLFLGRWNLDHDGWHGVLDIHHIPGALAPQQLGPGVGSSDARLGTYYGPDSQPRRVNGTISGNQIDFYIDWGNTGTRPYDVLSGLHFTGTLFGDVNLAIQHADLLHLAGSVLDNRDGKTYGFYAVRSHLPYTPTSPSSSPLRPAAFLGTWRLDLNGTWGTLRITSADSATGRLDGNWVGGINNQNVPVLGYVSFTDPYQVPSFYFGNAQLAGYMFNHETGVLAGGGQGWGFVGFRDNHPPTVFITYPTAAATLDFDLNLPVGTALHATVSDQEDGNSCCSVTWYENGVPIATGAHTAYAFQTPGAHTVTAVVTDLDGATAQAAVSFTLVNQPPTAKILKPAPGDSFIQGITYNNALLADHPLYGPPKVVTYTWTTGDGSDNLPKTGYAPTGVVFGTPGPRLLTLTVSDNYGQQARDSVSIKVIPPPPVPVIQFLNPLDGQDLLSLVDPSTGWVWVNIQIAPSSAPGRVVQLVWQAQKQGCQEEAVTLYWDPSILPPPGVKEVWGYWDTTKQSFGCFGYGIPGDLRLYVTDPNVATQVGQVHLFHSAPPN
jgi:hypothetical protein